MKNEKVFIFDIDGTLTPPRQKIKDSHYAIFMNFIIENEVWLVTGSDLKKTQEQLDGFILANVQGVFTCMGNVLHRNLAEIYNKTIEFDNDLLNELENIRKNSKYPYEKFGNHIEKRSGMINFSVLGRDTDFKNRKKYYEWDKKNGERKNITKWLSDYYGNYYDFAIGGEISIDIIQKGCDKSQCLNWLNASPEKLCSADLLFEDIVFFGDKTLEGGNDHSIAKMIEDNSGTVHHISGPEETFKIIYEKYTKS